jgi:hypothetical protein
VVKDDSTVVLGSYGAAQPTYTISGCGTDTITLDPNWNMSSSVTVPNGGYTLASGTSTVTSWSAYNYGPGVSITQDGITMKDGNDIKIGGKSLTEAIDKIEERLGILHPNPELEDRWEQLKALRKQYNDLEKELLEKEKMWKILKEK